MWIEYSKEIDEAKKFFLKMSREEYDKYMCATYPDLFTERNQPMNTTCMCWGFDIGPGWYWILNDLCKKTIMIKKATGITITFSQIKEKFAEGRFYNYRNIGNSSINWDEKEKNLWNKVIDNEVNRAQDLCAYTCEKCGEYKDDIIYIGNWAYALCEICLLKERPGIKKFLEDWKTKRDLKKSGSIWMANRKEISSLKKWSSNVWKRFEKEQDAFRKKFNPDLKKKKGIKSQNKENKK